MKKTLAFTALLSVLALSGCKGNINLVVSNGGALSTQDSSLNCPSETCTRPLKTNETFTINIAPEAGFSLKSIVGCDEITEAGCEIDTRNNPAADRTVTAEFKKESPSLEQADVFCSCGPTTTALSSVPANFSSMNFADGILVRVAWSDIQPDENTFDWSLIDNQIALASAYGAKVTLAIVNGRDAPQWLEKSGVKFFQYHDIANPDIVNRIPLPWDSNFLSYYSKLVSALGARYDQNPTVRLLHITNSTTNGFEMQYTFIPSDEVNFRQAGYSDDVLISSWKAVIDSYSKAFKSLPFDVEVHPVFKSDNVARQVADYGYSKLGKRFGLLSAWWSVKNAETVYPGMYSLIVEFSNKTFSNVQMVSTTSQSARNPMKESDFIDSVSLARNIGVSYIEIWNQDLLNADLMQRTAAM